MECPTHQKAFLYKQELGNGMVKICCMEKGCNWESEPIGRHTDLSHIPTHAELKRKWE